MSETQELMEAYSFLMYNTVLQSRTTVLANINVSFLPMIVIHLLAKGLYLEANHKHDEKWYL